MRSIHRFLLLGVGACALVAAAVALWFLLDESEGPAPLDVTPRAPETALPPSSSTEPEPPPTPPSPTRGTLVVTLLTEGEKRPVEGARIDLYLGVTDRKTILPPEGSAPSPPRQPDVTAFTDPAGRAEVGSLAPGPVGVMISSPGRQLPADQLFRSATARAGQVSQLRVMLPAGGTVTGIVVTPGADRLGGADVRIVPSEGYREGKPELSLGALVRYASRPGRGLHTVTASDGSFTLAGVPASAPSAVASVRPTGRHLLLVTHPDWAPAVIPVEAATDAPTPVTVRLPGPGLPVSGRVYDPDRSPVVGCRVQVVATPREGDSLSLPLTTGQAGVFRFPAVLDPGSLSSVVVGALDPTLGWAAARVDLRGGRPPQMSDLKLELARDHAVQVAVEGADGQPLSGAGLRLEISYAEAAPASYHFQDLPERFQLPVAHPSVALRGGYVEPPRGYRCPPTDPNLRTAAFLLTKERLEAGPQLTVTFERDR